MKSERELEAALTAFVCALLAKCREGRIIRCLIVAPTEELSQNVFLRFVIRAYTGNSEDLVRLGNVATGRHWVDGDVLAVEQRGACNPTLHRAYTIFVDA